MRIFGITVISVLVWTLFMPSVSVAAIEQERQWFSQARQALQQNKLETYKQLRAKLKTYPLTPYLDIWYSRKQLKSGNDSAVEEILRQHKAVPEASDLHIAWMKNLAKRGRWPHVAKHLDDFSRTASRLPELAMVSRWRMGEKAEALEQFSRRWQQGKRISDFSQPMFRAWEKLGHPTTAERWQRIGTYAKRGKWRTVKQLIKPLAKKERGWVKYWQSMQNNPAKALKHWPKGMPPKLARWIFTDGFKRLLRSDTLIAWQTMQKLDKTIKAEIGQKALALMGRHIALRAARRHMLPAASWLESLPEALKNEDTRAWQARLYVLFHDWEKLQLAITAMPIEQQRQSRWMYWQARALALTGNKKAALPLFTELATERGYYSFLSAEQLKLPFVFDVSEITVDAAASSETSAKPAIRRAYEWLQLGKRAKASREWGTFFAGSIPEQWKIAAHLAASWGWYDRTIHAAYRAGEKDALSDRFPMAYESQVKQASKRTGLEAAFIWSIIRQESAFNLQAVSRAGARGLMQLMPGTAREVARKNNLKRRSLFSARQNIRLGSLYLSEVANRFGGNPALAAAAYNAGPHRVNTWLKRTPFDAPEAWIEAIPFNETRRYVQQVMAFISVYEWRQAKTPSSLSTRISKSPITIKLTLNP